MPVTWKRSDRALELEPGLERAVRRLSGGRGQHRDYADVGDAAQLGNVDGPPSPHVSGVVAREPRDQALPQENGTPEGEEKLALLQRPASCRSVIGMLYPVSWCYVPCRDAVYLPGRRSSSATAKTGEITPTDGIRNFPERGMG